MSRCRTYFPGPVKCLLENVRKIPGQFLDVSACIPPSFFQVTPSCQLTPDSCHLQPVSYPPNSHKGGIPTELPPWKKGCHQTEDLEYTIWRPHFIPWYTTGATRSL